MMGLIASVSVALAASSFACDQVAHSASSSRTSSRTFVSTRTTVLAATGQRENLLRFHTHRRSAAQLREFAGAWLRASLGGAQRDLSAVQALKGDRRAGLQAQIITDLFRYSDLAFAGEVRCHK